MTSPVGVDPDNLVNFENCVSTTGFCGSCCGELIGSVHVVERQTCAEACMELTTEESDEEEEEQEDQPEIEDLLEP